MKELSIEEKAKAYDEVVNKLARFIEQGVDPLITRADVQDFFPELKESEEESEDEKIRKAIKQYVLFLDDTFPDKDSWLAWLEKQGQKDPCEDCKHPMLNCHNFPCSKKQKYQGKSALEAAKEEKIDNSNKVEPRFKESDWITNGENTIQITMVDTKSGYYRCFEGSHGFGWYVVDIESADKNYYLWTIADAKDGDILFIDIMGGMTFIFAGVNPKRAILYSFIINNDGKDVLPYDIGKPNVGIGHIYEGDTIYPATKEQRELLFSKMKEANYEWDSEKKELRKIEQKLAEKIEPRFKVGDFIVNNNSKDVYQVTEIRDDEYCLWPLDAEIMGYLRINDVDNEYYLWYIEDAKDGDVLTAHECYVIFKETDGLNIKCYCTYNYMGFNPNFYVSTLQNKTALQPATKEQKDFFFKRMEEEGYEWDDEHKELKKLETIDIDIPFSAKDSELIEATYFIPEGFHAEIVDNKVIIKKGEQKSTDTYCKENCKGYQETGKCYADESCKAKRDAEHDAQLTEEDALNRWLHFKNMYK